MLHRFTTLTRPHRGGRDGLDRTRRRQQTFRRHPRAARRRSDSPGRQLLLAARSLRLRQVDPAQDHCRAGGANGRTGADRRGRGRRPTAGRAQHRHGFSELRALPASDCGPEHRTAAGHAPPQPAGASSPARPDATRSPRQGGRHPGGGRSRRPHPRDLSSARAPPGTTLRRAEAARRRRPGPGPAPHSLPAGRAAVETSTPSCACRCARS